MRLREVISLRRDRAIGLVTDGNGTRAVLTETGHGMATTRDVLALSRPELDHLIESLRQLREAWET